MIKPAVLDAMVAAGCTAQQIAAAVKADQAASSGAERQARYRARKASQVTESDASDVTKRNTLSPKEIPPTPPKEITPIPSEAKASSLNPRGELQIVLDAERAKAVVDHRQRIGKPLTAHAARLLAGKLGKCSDPNFAADEMIANGWQGFKPEWLNSRASAAHPGGTGPPKPMTIGEMFREDARQNGILNDQPPANPPGRMETGDRDREVAGAGDPRVIALTRNVLGGFR